MILLGPFTGFYFLGLQISGSSQIFSRLIFSSLLSNFKGEVVRDTQNIHIMFLLGTALVEEVVKLDSSLASSSFHVHIRSL